MTTQFLDSFKQLRKESSKKLPDSIICGMNEGHKARCQLMVSEKNPKGGFRYIHVKGSGTSSRRKLSTIEATGGYTAKLNESLAGGESCPVLMFALSIPLGAMPGAQGVAAGLLFGAFSAALDAAKTHQGVQARVGDELWQIEEIGTSGNDVVHVNSYFLVDPFRGQAPTKTKGWLIHEERTVLTMP